jgi:hypothetical protein
VLETHQFLKPFFGGFLHKFVWVYSAFSDRSGCSDTGNRALKELLLASVLCYALAWLTPVFSKTEPKPHQQL